MPRCAAVSAGSCRTSIKATIGVSTSVVVRDPGAIERSAGKARRVIDKRRPLAPRR